MQDDATILNDTLDRLLSARVTPGLLRAAEEGTWPGALWQELVGLGLTEIFRGMSDRPWRDAAVVMRMAGRHALPLPLPETILASALLPEEEFDPLEPIAIIAWEEGEEAAWPWPDQVRRAIGISRDGTAHWLAREGEIGAPARSLTREPRHAARVKRGFSSGADARLLAALMRAAQMAGAIERVLALTVEHARTRVQFGKAISAFQAVQHQLAVLAGNAAAAAASVDAAFARQDRSEMPVRGGMAVRDTMAERDMMVAKIHAGEAAGLGAAIAHQLHGAIGFTDEHTLHFYTRRLWSWRAQFGNESEWARELGRTICAAGADSLWLAIATRD
ncbi:MAG: acyl-CoA dehydrogenase [Alphaproteobacteria bacterium]|nr:acyl-CoA dehydrogenase [Alphaproteobacteria bacterium]